jgi:hypothetical protein
LVCLFHSASQRGLLALQLRTLRRPADAYTVHQSGEFTLHRKHRRNRALFYRSIWIKKNAEGELMGSHDNNSLEA